MGGPGSGKKKMGRPTKLTKELGAEICRLIEIGNYLETAAACCDVPPNVCRKWVKEGIRGKDKLHADFAIAYKRAEGLAEASGLERIRQAAMKTWQADAWYLERRFPARWRRRDERAITGADGGALKIEQSVRLARNELEAALGLADPDDPQSSD